MGNPRRTYCRRRIGSILQGLSKAADILFGESVKLSWVKVPRVGIHFGWEASGEWFHAIGGRGEMIIEEWASAKRWGAGGSGVLLTVPALNPGSAAEMVGESCFNCLTGACKAAVRGFFGL